MRVIIVLLVLVVGLEGCKKNPDFIDLSGTWTVQADSISGTVQLPGSLTENGIGIPVSDSATNMLSEPVRFTGKAVYEKDIFIPDSWADKTVELYMERTKVCQVFVNDSLVGCGNSVSAPHIYLLKNVFQTGANRLKISVDNTKKLLPLGGSHAYSEHTQTNWNGILGKFYLKSLDDISLRDVQVYASTDGICRLSLSLLNTTEQSLKKQPLNIRIYDSKQKEILKKQISVDVPSGQSLQSVSFEIQNPELWDEYDPVLYRLTVDCGRTSMEKTFGFRNFHTQSGQFVNNERVVFLRGKHEGGVFPQAGYPSMKKEDWLHYFNVVRSYGINHVRFHSWTPPEAAFEAADECGVFLQPELPLWGRYQASDTLLINYMKSEGEKIMQAYGNHPSFVLFALGNELEGDTAVMARVTDHIRKKDNRHLYALGSNNFYWDPQTHVTEDFFVAMRHGKITSDYSSDLRGSFSFADSEEGGIINCEKPNTLRNYQQAIRTLNKPVIGHETGQYQVYPDFKEIEKYTGVMQARNFSVFKKRLEKAGMLSQAEDFLKASGALSALCYREEIEMALRTRGFGGFQLLDLQDYPGQGTALVGILNALLEPKEVISREKWTEFCADVVPLSLFSKYCWSDQETFTAALEVANYGKEDLREQEIICILKDIKGTIIFEQKYPARYLAQGKLTRIDSIAIPFQKSDLPRQMELSVALPSTPYRNAWNIWVYPSSINEKIREGVIQGVCVTRNPVLFEQKKKEGTPVLYIPKHQDIMENSVGGLFTTDFWNYGVFKNVALSLKKEPSPGTLGILTHPDHPLFHYFPTEFYTQWQWWSIIKNSRPVIMDEWAEDYYPLVQVIDNVDRNHKLGLIYEEPGYEGKALVCSSDLFACKEEPEVKSLFYSLLKYLTSNK